MSFFFGCECWMGMEGSEYVGMLSSFPYALQCIQVVSTGALERIVLRVFSKFNLATRLLYCRTFLPPTFLVPTHIPR